MGKVVTLGSSLNADFLASGQTHVSVRTDTDLPRVGFLLPAVILVKYENWGAQLLLFHPFRQKSIVSSLSSLLFSFCFLPRIGFRICKGLPWLKLVFASIGFRDGRLPSFDALGFCLSLDLQLWHLIFFSSVRGDIDAYRSLSLSCQGGEVSFLWWAL